MRISKKINLGFTVVILLAVITTLYSINSYKNLTYKSIGDSSLLLAKKIINSIDKNIHYRIEEIQFMSTSPIVQTVLEESNEYFESIENPLEYIFELNKNWVSAVVNVYTPFMENIINNRLSRILQKRQRFYSRKYGYEVFAEMFVTNRFGANVSQTGRTFDYYQADEEWWIFAKRNGINISDAEYDRSAGIYSVDISVRIDDEPGNFLGVMKTVLNIKDIFEVIHKVEVDSEQESKSIEFLLLGSNGKVIYSKERFKYNEDISNLFQIEKKVIKNSNSFIHRGEEIYTCAFSNGFKDYKGLGWRLIVSYKAEKILEPINKLQRTLILILFTITIIAVSIGFFVSRQISKPIIKLKDAAILIGSGKLQTRIKIDSKDEIGILTKYFNEMVGDIENQIETIKCSEQEIKSINKKLENYTYTISHDLKEPIRSIRTFSEFITEDYSDCFNAEAKDYFNRIKNAATKMAYMIDDLLVLSRIGRENVIFQKTCISNIIEEVKSNLNLMITQTGVDIIFSDMPCIICQPLWLSAVFHNLISNSIKYGNNDKIIIKISYCEFSEFHEFSIKDNGKGIDTDQWEKIFGLFRKGHQDRNIAGSGAGLAIVSSVIEEHKGKVWVDESVPEKGTVIKFTIKKSLS